MKTGIALAVTGLVLTIGAVGGAEFGKMNLMAVCAGVAAMAVGAIIMKRGELYED